MAQTLLLDTATWDLVLDASGNIAVASPPYQLAQDAASSIKLFQGELYYSTDQGVPYWQQILGHWPPVPLLKAYLQNAALTVPGVLTAKCFIASFIRRQVKGQVQITDANSKPLVIGF